MKTAVAAVSVAFLVALLAACEPETRPHRPPPPQPGITGETPTPSPTPVDPNASPTPDPNATPSPTPDPNAPPTPSPSPSPAAGGADASIPYAQPVPGKPGYVISPYSNQGFVNVEGLPPNSLARCPYTKKIFRVP